VRLRSGSRLPSTNFFKAGQGRVRYRRSRCTYRAPVRLGVRTVFAALRTPPVPRSRKPCKSKADARTRTGDPFITSFEPLSPPVTVSHPQVTPRAESSGLQATHELPLRSLVSAAASRATMASSQVMTVPMGAWRRSVATRSKHRGAELVNPDLTAGWLQAVCADESAVGAGRQVQLLSVQARGEVRGGTE
jgi:hypothetical protein